ncbi:hypothetical protein DL93DRAFT_1565242 [Clavulina sp. PMI_390]|nr:hypothetical protein DL93DRAFT_1565242 [Clavulina sp. PMI_390]
MSLHHHGRETYLDSSPRGLGDTSTCPISHLPAELLTKVFEELVHEFSAFDFPRLLFRITSVCALWRAVAIASPVLWTRIYYGPRHVFILQKNSEEKQLVDAAFEWAMTCLERSQSAPLHIFLEGSYRSSAEIYHFPKRREDLRDLGEVLNFLVPYLPRCRDLTLRSTYIGARQLWGMLRPVKFDLLQQVSFDDSDELYRSLRDTFFTTSSGDIRDYCMTSESLNRLRMASYNLRTLQPIPITKSLGCFELKVSTTGKWWDNLVISLLELPLLHHLTVIFVGPTLNLGWDLERRVEVPNLEYLETNFLPFSVNLCTPRLTELVLCDLRLPHWPSIAQAEAYCNHRWPYPTLRPPMSLIQALSRFSIVDCKIERGFMERKQIFDSPWGTEILNKMMLSMGNISVDTLNFVRCCGIERILRTLASPIASLAGGSDESPHTHADSQAPVRDLSYLLPNLRELDIIGYKSNDATFEALSMLSRNRPGLRVEGGEQTPRHNTSVTW